MIRRTRFLGGTAMLLCVFVMRSPAQISPGALSSAHSSLEGIEHCTACHTLGKSISNVNCLHCHTEIDTRMHAGTGFHGTLAGRQCIECHKEHRGRDFPMEKFDPRTFRHDDVKYSLVGRHAAIACRDCHKKDLLKAQDILRLSDDRKKTTYLGLQFSTCTSCHHDPHAGKFPGRCERCYTTSGWLEGATRNFDHSTTRYPLLGKHRLVRCEQCHGSRVKQTSVRRGDRGPFRIDRFTRCTDCHGDPHNKQFVRDSDHGACEGCHGPKSRVKPFGVN